MPVEKIEIEKSEAMKAARGTKFEEEVARAIRTAASKRHLVVLEPASHRAAKGCGKKIRVIAVGRKVSVRVEVEEDPQVALRKQEASGSSPPKSTAAAVEVDADPVGNERAPGSERRPGPENAAWS